MPYTPLNLADIEAGKPVKEELFTTIRDNEEYLNNAIDGLQQSSTIDIFNLKFGGDITNYTEAEILARVPVFRAPADATMIAFVVTLLTASTSGDLEIQLDKSTDDGVSWTELLNNPVTVSGTTVGSVSGTVDWVDVAAQSFEQGDLLRIRIEGVQVGQGEFHVQIYGDLG